MLESLVSCDEQTARLNSYHNHPFSCHEPRISIARQSSRCASGQLGSSLVFECIAQLGVVAVKLPFSIASY